MPSVSSLFTKRDSPDNTHNIVKVTENVSYILSRVHYLKHLLRLSLSRKKNCSERFQRLNYLYVFKGKRPKSDVSFIFIFRSNKTVLH